MTALEIHEQRRLDICEERIKRGLATFVDVGKALTEIRDARLYREAHGTFDEYCRERWGFTDRRARQMIEAAEIGRILPVENAGQANELARVPEEDRAEVWAETNERTDGRPTAAAIRDVREERYPSSPPVRDEPLLDGEGERRTVPAGSDTPRAQEELPDDSPPASPVEDLGAPAPSVNDDVAEFPDLAYYRDKGDTGTVTRIAAALRGYDPAERERRLDNLRKTIAAEQRRDEQPEPKPSEPDYAAMADAMFTACNKAMGVITSNGDSVTIAEAVATSDPLTYDNWRGQFEQLAHACQRMADACRPQLRRVK